MPPRKTQPPANLAVTAASSADLEYHRIMVAASIVAVTWLPIPSAVQGSTISK